MELGVWVTKHLFSQQTSNHCKNDRDDDNMHFYSLLTK